MRIVISGGGIAGLTLAAKLRQQGREPIVVEQADAYERVGYSLGLWPLGSCVFHGLGGGAYEELVERSSVPEVYEFGDHTGRVLQRAPLDIVSDHGDPILMVPRPDVVDVLVKACGDVDLRMGTTVTSVEDHGDVVEVGLSSGASIDADLLIIAEGTHAATRQLVFGPVETFDTHWVIWTWWGKPGRTPETTLREFWGPGQLFGVYPCPGKVAVGAGFPTDRLDARDAPTEEIRAHIRKANEELLASDPGFDALVEDAESFFPWTMEDVRSSHWSKGRVVVCGDAGTAFLPTAGVGASNALRSAAALADELSRAGAATVPLALDLYEQRCRKIVEANQKDSRALARYMFIENRALSWARDQVLRHYPPTKMVDEIVESQHTPF